MKTCPKGILFFFLPALIFLLVFAVGKVRAVWSIDLAPPTVQVISIASSASASTITLSFNLNDTGGSGLKKWEILVGSDGTNYSSSGQGEDNLPPGTNSLSKSNIIFASANYFKISVWDYAGNQGSSGVFATATVRGSLYEDQNKNRCKDPSDKNTQFGTTPTVNLGLYQCQVNLDSFTFRCLSVSPEGQSSFWSSPFRVSGYAPYTEQFCSNPECTNRSCTVSLSAGQILSWDLGFSSGAWFQTQGGDVHAQGDLKSVIPSQVAPAEAYFSKELDSYPGLVSYFFESQPDFGSGTASPKGWLANSSLALAKSTYSYFWKKLGSPTEDNFNGSLLEISADGTYYSQDNVAINSKWNFPSGRKAIILVNGDLAINEEIQVPVGSFLAFIVKGNINISGQKVGDKSSRSFSGTNAHLQGVYLAGGETSEINTYADRPQGEGSGFRFVGAGLFYAQGDFNLGRDLKKEEGGAINNSTTPAELFIFRPDLVLNAPRELWYGKMSWLEVAP